MNQILRATEVLNGRDAQLALLRGIKTLHDPVASTLGAAGRTVIIENIHGRPHPTKDGVTVAKSIVPIEGDERMGSEIIKQAALNTADEAGDGTTSSVVLAYHLVKDGMEALKNHNYTDFNKGMQLAVEDIFGQLDEQTVQVGLSDIDAVATISANNDPVLGGIIADAFRKAGENGVVLMDTSQTEETFVKVTEGFELESGYRSEVFVNNREAARVEYNNALILVSNVKIETIEQIEPELEYAIENNLPIVIISEMENDVVATIALNVVKTKKIRAVVVNPTHFGVRRHDILSDLALYTGATLISDQTGDNFGNVTFDWLGHADRVVISKNKTIFFGGQGDINDHVSELKSRMENTKDGVEKTFLKERIAKISSSVAVVHVGASSEAEHNEKADRVDDAIHATRAALEGGIVPGGGVALYNCAPLASTHLMGESMAAGYQLVFRAIEQPLMQILENADIPFDVELFGLSGRGINVKTGEEGEMMEMQIIDPTKVVKTALKNAVSVASTILSTKSVIVNLRSMQ